jgi:hypothetical protein
VVDRRQDVWRLAWTRNRPAGYNCKCWGCPSDIGPLDHGEEFELAYFSSGAHDIDEALMMVRRVTRSTELSTFDAGYFLSPTCTTHHVLKHHQLHGAPPRRIHVVP